MFKGPLLLKVTTFVLQILRRRAIFLALHRSNNAYTSDTGKTYFSSVKLSRAGRYSNCSALAVIYIERDISPLRERLNVNLCVVDTQRQTYGWWNLSIASASNEASMPARAFGYLPGGSNPR